MNKTQLVDAVTKQTRVPKGEVETVVNAIIDVIKKNIKKGDDVTLLGFGTFTRTFRQARNGVNPQTGKEITIPQMVLPKFRAGRDFRDSLN